MTDFKPTAKVILDSISPDGHRLTTMQWTYPRRIHSEVMTHRKKSKNSASSRAIPAKRFLELAITEPATPFDWPREQKGMQGGAELEGQDLSDAQAFWDGAYTFMTEHVGQYLESHPEPATRLHKARINRLLEPFIQHTIIVSSTEWDNFFRQRISPEAETEIDALARAAKEALDASIPQHLEYSEWHTPYITDDDYEEAIERNLTVEETADLFKKISVARCARVSYLSHEGKRDWLKDLALHGRLKTSGHWSPFEHVATPFDDSNSTFKKLGNFDGWGQLRHEVEFEAWLDETA